MTIKTVLEVSTMKSDSFFCPNILLYVTWKCANMQGVYRSNFELIDNCKYYFRQGLEYSKTVWLYDEFARHHNELQSFLLLP